MLCEGSGCHVWNSDEDWDAVTSLKDASSLLRVSGGVDEKMCVVLAACQALLLGHFLTRNAQDTGLWPRPPSPNIPS